MNGNEYFLRPFKTGKRKNVNTNKRPSKRNYLNRLVRKLLIQRLIKSQRQQFANVIVYAVCRGIQAMSRK